MGGRVDEPHERSPLAAEATPSTGGTQQVKAVQTIDRSDAATQSYVAAASTYLTDVNHSLWKLWPLLLGNMLDWYEFGTYAFVEDELTANFFSSATQTWTLFSLSFVLRPIGGLLIGMLGDKIGRKRATLYSVCGMTVATVGQGCLLSRKTGGPLSQVSGMCMLFVFRSIQGLCTGGEAGGVITYVSEAANRSSMGMLSSAVGATCCLAYSLSAFVVWTMRVCLTEDQMTLWGWRVPFLLSALPAYYCLSRLSRMEETKEFKELGLDTEVDALEVMTLSSSLNDTYDVFRNHGKRVLMCFLALAGQGAMWYAGSMYAVNYVHDRGGDIANATAMSAGAQLVGTLTAPLFGALTDLVGVNKVVMGGMGLCLLVAIPSYVILEAYPRSTVDLFFAIVVMLGVAQASAGSTIYLWASEVFPTRVRFAAVGLAYNLSIGVFGGCAPLICQVMDAHMSLFPGYYMTFLCAVSLVTCAYAHHLNATGTMVMAHMRPELY